MGEFGATCSYMLSDRARDLNPDQWDAERFGMLCTKAESYAEWKKSILKLCKLTKRCTFEETKAINEVFKKIKALEDQTKIQGQFE